MLSCQTDTYTPALLLQEDTPSMPRTVMTAMTREKTRLSPILEGSSSLCDSAILCRGSFFIDYKYFRSLPNTLAICQSFALCVPYFVLFLKYFYTLHYKKCFKNQLFLQKCRSQLFPHNLLILQHHQFGYAKHFLTS